MSGLFVDIHVAFGLQPVLGMNPAAARRILRLCLPYPLTVAPDPAGGWTFAGEGRFSEAGLQAEVKGIRGHVVTPNPDPLKMVPPG